VLLGLQPLTTTAVTILSSLRLDTSRLQSYLLRVLPAKHFDRGYEKLLMELLVKLLAI